MMYHFCVFDQNGVQFNPVIHATSLYHAEFYLIDYCNQQGIEIRSFVLVNTMKEPEPDPPCYIMDDVQSYWINLDK